MVEASIKARRRNFFISLLIFLTVIGGSSLVMAQIGPVGEPLDILFDTSAPHPPPPPPLNTISHCPMGAVSQYEQHEYKQHLDFRQKVSFFIGQARQREMAGLQRLHAQAFNHASVMTALFFLSAVLLVMLLVKRSSNRWSMPVLGGAFVILFSAAGLHFYQVQQKLSGWQESLRIELSQVGGDVIKTDSPDQLLVNIKALRHQIRQLPQKYKDQTERLFPKPVWWSLGWNQVFEIQAYASAVDSLKRLHQREYVLITNFEFQRQKACVAPVFNKKGPQLPAETVL